MKIASCIIALLAASTLATYALTTNLVLSLDGSGDYVAVPDNSLLDLTNSYTFEAWVSIDNTNQTTDTHGVVCRPRSGGSSTGQRLGVVWDGRPDFGFNDFVNNIAIYDTNYLSPHAWAHLAAVFDGSAMSLYVNGQLAATTNAPFPALNSDQPLYIGAEQVSGGRYFHGEIDEVRVWRAARSQSDIQSNMLVRLVGTEPNLVGYWNFDDGTANDSGTNNLDGAFVGNATTIEDSFTINQIYMAAEIVFWSMPFTQYQLQYASELPSTNWINIGPPINGDGQEHSFFDGPRGASPRYYRVITAY